MVLVPGVLLVIAELILRLASVGFSTSFFLADPDGHAFITNDRFGWFFQKSGLSSPQPCRIISPKPAGTVRIFVLGESAAMGCPDPAFGFARILEVMLRDQLPNHHVEVVNAAMRGINSHVVRQIARECAALEPDLMVIYLGNNEVAGLYGPSDHGGYLAVSLPLARLYHKLRVSRCSQLIWMAIRGHPDAPPTGRVVQDMDFFRRHRVPQEDWRRQAVYRNYRANLEEVVQTSLHTGASVVLSTIASNLRDFPPLGSLWGPALDSRQQSAWDEHFSAGIQKERAGDWQSALQNYLQAQEVDAHHAELVFRSARCYLALGHTNKALGFYLLARDLDAIQFRADSSINDAIRQVASQYASERLALVDLEWVLTQTDTNGQRSIPGLNYFLDHVHFRFDGDYLAARTFLPSITNALSHRFPQSFARTSPVLTRDECARRLGLTFWDEVQLEVPTVELTRKAPFLDQADHAVYLAAAENRLAQLKKRLETIPASQHLRTYDYALKLAPDDWIVRHNYAVILNAVGDKSTAVKQMEQVVRSQPQVENFRIVLGYLLAETGQLKEAEIQFSIAQRLKPRSRAVRQADLWLSQQRTKKPVDSAQPR
jgi:tetratricopeptide (TPR) repeat protein